MLTRGSLPAAPFRLPHGGCAAAQQAAGGGCKTASASAKTAHPGCELLLCLAHLRRLALRRLWGLWVDVRCEVRAINCRLVGLREMQRLIIRVTHMMHFASKQAHIMGCHGDPGMVSGIRERADACSSNAPLSSNVHSGIRDSGQAAKGSLAGSTSVPGWPRPHCQTLWDPAASGPAAAPPAAPRLAPSPPAPGKRLECLSDNGFNKEWKHRLGVSDKSERIPTKHLGNDSR